MLDIMGREYVVDCCVAELNKYRSLENFEIYVTDIMAAILMAITGNKHVERYHDLVSPKPVDTRSGTEIAIDIIKKHGLKVVS